MTTARDIIKEAYREGNLLAASSTPTDIQNTEGLGLLNGILDASVGNEIGRELADLNVGGIYDQREYLTEYIPEGARIFFQLEDGISLRLHPAPHDGQRFAVVDTAGNLSTNNVTLDGFGRTIEGGQSLVLNEDGLSREWIYRADTGDWSRLSSLDLDSTMPFPIEFDDYFRVLLSMRLNPRYGQELQQTSALWLESQASRLQARYRKPRPIEAWATRNLLNQRGYAYGGSTAAFNRGRSWL